MMKGKEDDPIFSSRPGDGKWEELSHLWAITACEVGKLQTLIRLCEGSAQNAEEHLIKDDPICWPDIFEIMNTLTEGIEKKLGDMDSLITFCRQYQERGEQIGLDQGS
jgi:hypothetical protein